MRPDSPHQFNSVLSLSHVRLFAMLWTAAHQASLSIANSWSLLKLMSIESVMPSNHLILCHPFLLPPLIFPSIRVFSNESVPMSQVAKVLAFQLQHRSFQWTLLTNHHCSRKQFVSIWLISRVHLCDPMDHSPSGCSVHGILQARVLQWVAISISRESSWPRDWTWDSCIGRQILYHWAIREAL